MDEGEGLKRRGWVEGQGSEEEGVDGRAGI